MARSINLKKLKKGGVQFYPQTHTDAVIVDETSGKTLTTRLSELAARDVTVDSALSASSANPVQNKIIKAELDKKLALSDFNAKVGANNGICPLDSTGIIASQYLPGYVDDVVEFKSFITAKPSAAGLYFNTPAKKLEVYTELTPADIELSESKSPESGKIYVNLADSKVYRWSGSAMTVISETIALGETSSTAFPGNRGKAVETGLSALTPRVSTAEAHINAIGGTLDRMDQDISAAATKANANATDISGLKTRMTSAENSIKSINTTVGSLQNADTALSNRITAIENSMITSEDIA